MGGDETTMFHGKIHEYLNLNKNKVVVDLSKTEWTNTLGLGMLIAGHAAVKKANGKLVLANITNIENILAITQLLKVFETYDSLEAALESFA